MNLRTILLATFEIVGYFGFAASVIFILALIIGN